MAVPLAVGCVLGLPAPAAFAQPPNDNFANAQVVTGFPATATGTNVDATGEPGEPEHGGLADGMSVWFRWTAPQTGTAIVDTCDSDFDTILAVYTGSSVSSLTRVAGNDDGCGDLQSRVRIEVTAGATYEIAVDGASDTGSIRLRIAPPPVAEPGTYSGRTDFGEGIRFTLNRARTRLLRFVVSYDMNCTNGFTESRTVIARIPVGRDGRFSVRLTFRFRGGARQLFRMSGRFQPPRRASGSLSSRGTFPGAGRCQTLGRIGWTARHR